MMERHRRVDDLRRALPHLKDHGIGAGGAVGIERHKHFARADKLVAAGTSDASGAKLRPLRRHRLVKAVNLGARKAVGDMHRTAGWAPPADTAAWESRGQVQRMGDLKYAIAPYLDIDGRNAVHRRGIAVHGRAAAGA